MKLQIDCFHGVRGRGLQMGWIFLAVFLAMVPVSKVCAQAPVTVAASADPVCFKYDINCSAYHIIEDVLKPNQNLSQILTAYNIPISKVYRISQKSRPIQDLRKLKAGNPYTLMLEPDSENTARYFIYEKNLMRYVVYDLSDPVDVYQGQKILKTQLRIASATVHSPSQQRLIDVVRDADLTASLAEIYCWNVDFQNLEEGDHCVVIFQNYRKDRLTGLNHIVAARFHHGGKDYYAFYFTHKGREAFYDEHGRSLHRTFLKAPLRYLRITSRPSPNRLHPILKIRRPHLGTDYAAPHGTPIYAIGDGTVKKTGNHRHLGKHLIIEHNMIYKSQYLHLADFAKGIRSGIRVNRGEVIGYVGSTGLATGPHLEFRFWKNGNIFSHIDANGSAVEALEGEAMLLFQHKTSALKDRLDTHPVSNMMVVSEYGF